MEKRPSVLLLRALSEQGDPMVEELRRYGCDVETADNVCAMLRKMRSERYDILVVDESFLLLESPNFLDAVSRMTEGSLVIVVSRYLRFEDVCKRFGFCFNARSCMDALELASLVHCWRLREQSLATQSLSASGNATLLHTVLDNVPAGIVVYDAHTLGVVEANALGLHLSCVRRADGRSVAGITPTGPVSRALSRASRDKSAKTISAIPHRADDGTVSYWDLTITPLKSPEDEVKWLCAVFSETTSHVAKSRSLASRYDQEHRIAQAFQKALTPDLDLKVEGLEFAGRYRPALTEAQVGGDIYDVFWLKDGSIGIVIADVSGKGLAAAVQTAMVKYAIAAYAVEGASPAEVVARLDRIALQRLEPDQFITLFYGVLDPSTRSLTYTNAGHDYPLLVRGTGRTSWLKSTGPIIGLLVDAAFAERTVVLRPMDTLVLYTDGVVGIRVNGARLGSEGLRKMVKPISKLSCRDVVNAVFDQAMGACADRIDDDIAILAIRAY